MNAVTWEGYLEDRIFITIRPGAAQQARQKLLAHLVSMLTAPEGYRDAAVNGRVMSVESAIQHIQRGLTC